MTRRLRKRRDDVSSSRELHGDEGGIEGEPSVSSFREHHLLTCASRISVPVHFPPRSNMLRRRDAMYRVPATDKRVRGVVRRERRSSNVAGILRMDPRSRIR